MVAYSGGMDSTALLHALRCTRDLTGGRLRAIHVCHHLHPAATQWADGCARQCAAWSVHFQCLDVRVNSHGLGTEAAARKVRYAALAAALAPGEVLIAAHHADDQAETFLLQALRGAGVAGLAAMPELAALGAGHLWRPWRHVERAAIRAYALAEGLEWIDDPSNADPAIDRARLRRNVWPALVERWPAAARTLSRSAQWAASAAEAVTALAAIDVERAGAASGALRIAALRPLSTARQAAAIRLWLRRGEFDTPDHRHAKAIVSLLDVAEHASPRVCFAASEVHRFDGCLFAMPRLPSAPRDILNWRMGDVLALPAGAGLLRWRGTSTGPPALTVSFRRGGERLSDHRGRERALKDWLREARIPPWVRERMPLIYRGDTLVAVAGRWHHPEIDGLLGVENAGFDWRHELVGDPERVVEDGGLG